MTFILNKYLILGTDLTVLTLFILILNTVHVIYLLSTNENISPALIKTCSNAETF